MPPIAQCGPDLRTQPGQIHDHLANAGAREGLEVPGDEWLAAHDQQRLGRVIGEGSHAFAATRGEQHGFHADTTCGTSRALAGGSAGTTLCCRNSRNACSCGKLAQASTT